jgi:predicted Zn-dependent peptidase
MTSFRPNSWSTGLPPTGAASGGTRALPAPAGCRKTVLENGIRIVTQRLPGARSVSLGVLIDAGPRQEGPAQCGLAHLTEHLMFQGTSNRDALRIARDLDLAGGHTGAFTARDYTCYHATVLDDHCTYALDLLGDLLLNSIFPEESVRREKQTIRREIDSDHDAPHVGVNDLLKEQAWNGHRLGRPIAGWPDSMDGLTREDVIFFVHEHYLPDRILVAAAGNLDHDDFVAQARDAFWRLLGESDQASGPPPVYHSGVRIEHKALSQAYFALGLPAGGYAHEGRDALHVLTSLLGVGSSSRLFRQVREERGLVYDIGAEYHAYRDAGLVVIQGSTAPEHLRAVLELILLELARLAWSAEPVSDEELWKGRMQLRSQQLLGGESSSTRMSRLATQEFYFSRVLADEEILQGIALVDGDALQQLRHDRLASALTRIALAVVGPEAPACYSPETLTDLLDQFGSPPAAPASAPNSRARSALRLDSSLQ